MAKAKELGALAVQSINRRGINFVGGVAGLGLYVQAGGSRSWIFRFRLAGMRRDMGLGGYPEVSLARARDQARDAREKLRDGVDPIELARSKVSALVAARAVAVTFGKAAALYIEAHEPTWKNAKHRQQWENTLTTYAEPTLGRLLVRDVELPHILLVLEKIWKTKTETASRLRGRIEAVLDWATARGYRSGPNPARWKGHLDTILPAPGKIAKVDHHRALPYSQISTFISALRSQEGIGATALEFTILTAARSGEVRGATWPEFDLAAAIWTVPANRMKAGKEHRVPLSARAVTLLQTQKDLSHSEFAFPAPRGGSLSDMTLTSVLRRMNINAVPHGFRSTFRDWVADQTDYPNEVAEMALAHIVGNKVEAAYRRGDLLDKRRQLMTDWAAFVG